MNLPEWLETHADEIGTRRLNGEITRQEAITALRDEIKAKDDQALINSVLSAYASKILDEWHKARHDPRVLGPLAQVQAELFPGLPRRLYVAPATPKALMLCTGHDWDMAYKVLENRTRRAKEGAEEDWEQFEHAYKLVRPLLDGDLTTADVVGQIDDTPGTAAL